MFKQSKKIERLNSIRAALALVIWFSVAPAHAVPRHPCIAANEGGLYQPTVGAVIGTFRDANEPADEGDHVPLRHRLCGSRW